MLAEGFAFQALKSFFKLYLRASRSSLLPHFQMVRHLLKGTNLSGETVRQAGLHFEIYPIFAWSSVVNVAVSTASITPAESI